MSDKIKEIYERQSMFWPLYQAWYYQCEDKLREGASYLINKLGSLQAIHRVRVLDLGSGKLDHTDKYTFNWFGLLKSDNYLLCDHENDTMIQLDFTDEDEVIKQVQSRKVRGLSSYFALELYCSPDYCLNLYKRIFEETELEFILTSGFYLPKSPHQKSSTEAGLEVFHSNYDVEAFLPSLVDEYRLNVYTPSTLFGDNVTNVWRLLRRKSR